MFGVLLNAKNDRVSSLSSQCQERGKIINMCKKLNTEINDQVLVIEKNVSKGNI